MSINYKNPFLTWAALLLLTAGGAHAEIKLPQLLRDGAVLQRNEPIPVWGTASPGITISIEFAGKTQRVQSDKNGQWRTTFDERAAGGPFQLTISDGDELITVKDILIGDVWVASGQSNMEWPLRNTTDAEAEISSTNNKQIRHFKIPKSWAVSPVDELAGGQWLPAMQEHLPEFSGVGWYFAKRINAETAVPVGLINATWGGSNIESWMSSAALGATPQSTAARINELTAKSEQRAAVTKKTLQRWPNVVVDHVTEADADWSAANINDNDWLKIKAPGLWEKRGYEGMDGVIWYRKSFRLSEAEAARDIVLGLGRIDDNDITWINGNRVGETNAYDVARTYKVPAKFLKAGENQIAVRVEDTGGGGGIYSDAELLYLEISNGERRSLAGEWKLRPDKVTVSILDNINQTDTALYNKMLHPLFNTPIKGVIWYQGESNAGNAEEAAEYREQFKTMITDWRTRWNNPDMPFYWVQLANFNSHGDTEDASPWAILRESQTAALALENTGQAVIIDVGDAKDIHPRDKKTVGERLARIALNRTYGKDKVHFRGPVFESAQVKGDRLIVQFKHHGQLKTADKNSVVAGFEIAGEDGKFITVEGRIKRGRVVLPLSGVTPASLRYAWSDNPEDANLMDKEGLPAEPFRTDL